MPIYEYRCDAGHRDMIVCPVEDRDCWVGTGCYQMPADPAGDICALPLKRVFSFSSPRVLHSHFNPTVGKEVTSMRGFRDDLARASDAATERTGVPHDFQPVDLGEVGRETVTDEGMGATHDRWKEIHG